MLHGPDRHDAFADWKERGGVGVTTLDALRGFPAPGDGEVGLLVVDEAHFVKNPKTKRSWAVGSVAFRKAVAPVYLRRHQEDVLTELPNPQQTDEWGEPSASYGEA